MIPLASVLPTKLLNWTPSSLPSHPFLMARARVGLSLPDSISTPPPLERCSLALWHLPNWANRAPPRPTRPSRLALQPPRPKIRPMRLAPPNMQPRHFPLLPKKRRTAPPPQRIPLRRTHFGPCVTSGVTGALEWRCRQRSKTRQRLPPFSRVPPDNLSNPPQSAKAGSRSSLNHLLAFLSKTWLQNCAASSQHLRTNLKTRPHHNHHFRSLPVSRHPTSRRGRHLRVPLWMENQPS